MGRATPGREGFVNHAKGSLIPPRMETMLLRLASGKQGGEASREVQVPLTREVHLASLLLEGFLQNPRIEEGAGVLPARFNKSRWPSRSNASVRYVKAFHKPRILCAMFALTVSVKGCPP